MFTSSLWGWLSESTFAWGISNAWLDSSVKKIHFSTPDKNLKTIAVLYSGTSLGHKEKVCIADTSLKAVLYMNQVI